MRNALLPLLLSPLLSGCVVGTVARTAVDVVTLPVKAASAGVDAVTTSQKEADEKRPRASQAGRGARQAGPDGAGTLPQGQGAAERRLRRGGPALTFGDQPSQQP